MCRAAQGMSDAQLGREAVLSEENGEEEQGEEESSEEEQGGEDLSKEEELSEEAFEEAFEEGMDAADEDIEALDSFDSSGDGKRGYFNSLQSAARAARIEILKLRRGFRKEKTGRGMVDCVPDCESVCRPDCLKEEVCPNPQCCDASQHFHPSPFRSARLNRSTRAQIHRAGGSRLMPESARRSAERSAQMTAARCSRRVVHRGAIGR
jgi:hypothetical protein